MRTFLPYTLSLVLLGLLCITTAPCANAQVPGKIAYQGQLRDADGALGDGTYVATFELYDSAEAGEMLWREVQSLTVVDGIFNIQLGENNAIDLPFDSPYWLGVQINGEAQTPRMALSAVPYAFKPMRLPEPDYDSDWFSLSSQAGTASFTEVVHNLGDYPSLVKVLVRAVDGANEGFIFEGLGAAQNDDDTAAKNYGGLVFAYNEERVRLWAPDRSNNESTGRIINVLDGWGGEVFAQGSNDAEVRVLAWK
jgi:hypothetical protein